MAGGSEFCTIIAHIRRKYRLSIADAAALLAVSVDTASSGTYPRLNRPGQTLDEGAAALLDWVGARVGFSNRFVMSIEGGAKAGKFDQATGVPQAHRDGGVELRTSDGFYGKLAAGATASLHHFGGTGGGGLPQLQVLVPDGEGDHGGMIGWRCLTKEGYDELKLEDLEMAASRANLALEPGVFAGSDETPLSDVQIKVLAEEVEAECIVDPDSGVLAPPSLTKFDGLELKPRSLLVMGDADGWKVGSKLQATSFDPTTDGRFIDITVHEPAVALILLAEQVQQTYDKVKETFMKLPAGSLRRSVAAKAPPSINISPTIFRAGALVGLAETTDHRPLARGIGHGAVHVGVVYSLAAAVEPARLELFIELLQEDAPASKEPSRLEVIRAMIAYLVMKGVPELDKFEDEIVVGHTSSLQYGVLFASASGFEEALTSIRQAVLVSLGIAFSDDRDPVVWETAYVCSSLMPETGFFPLSLSPDHNSPASPPSPVPLKDLVGSGCVGSPKGLPFQLALFEPFHYNAKGVDLGQVRMLEPGQANRRGEDFEISLAEKEEEAEEVARSDERRARKDEEAGRTCAYDSEAQVASARRDRQADRERNLDRMKGIVNDLQKLLATTLSPDLVNKLAAVKSISPLEVQEATQIRFDIEVSFEEKPSIVISQRNVPGVKAIIDGLLHEKSSKVLTRDGLDRPALKLFTTTLDLDPFPQSGILAQNAFVRAFETILKGLNCPVPSSFVAVRAQQLQKVESPFLRLPTIARLILSMPLRRHGAPVTFAMSNVEHLDRFLQCVGTPGWDKTLLAAESEDRTLQLPDPPTSAKLRQGGIPDVYKLGQPALDFIITASHYDNILAVASGTHKGNAEMKSLELAVKYLGIFSSSDLESARKRPRSDFGEAVEYAYEFFSGLTDGSALEVRAFGGGTKLWKDLHLGVHSGLNRLEMLERIEDKVAGIIGEELDDEPNSPTVRHELRKRFGGDLKDRQEWEDHYAELKATKAAKKSKKKTKTKAEKQAERAMRDKPFVSERFWCVFSLTLPSPFL